MRLIYSAFLIAIALLSGPAFAQSGYNPVLTVNGDAITGFELSQREKLLRLFNTPGNVAEVAREQLIDEKLKRQEMRRAGLALTQEGLNKEMAGFAARANMSLDQFLQVLSQNGIARETLRDFVQVGASWRDYARRKFSSRLSVSDADLRRATGAPTGTTIEVLLSEIIIPAPPQLAGRARAEARRIAGLRSQSAFSAAARQVSALPSRENGGRLGWVPISNYPPQLRPVILGLTTNEITAPIEIPGAVALFQMRGIRESAAPRPAPQSIEYLTFALPGGMSDKTQAEAASILARVDRCDDFYGIARDLPREQLQRQTVAPSQIPSDIAQVMASLDANEGSFGLTRNQGQTMLMVMVCARNYGAPGQTSGQNTDPDTDPDTDQRVIADRIAGQQLESIANAYLADLRARAVIR